MDSLAPKSSIKRHVLLLTLLPSLLITALLTSYFIITRQSDAQDDLIRQTSSTIKYLSKVSEFAFFAGNKDELNRLVRTINSDRDIKTVIFFDNTKKELLVSGDAVLEPIIRPKNDFYQEDLGKKWLFQMPVYFSSDDVSDFPNYEVKSGSVQYLGWIQIFADKRRLQKRQRSILIKSTSIGIIVFIILSLLAHKFSRSITRPLERITKAVQKLEAGDLTARVGISDKDLAKGELETLVNGINRLAEKVELSNENLQKRVDSAVIKLTQTLDELENNNNKLKKTSVELIEANKAKDDFLAGMSHELRTPLTAIIGYSRLLKQSNLQKQQKSHVKIIRQASTMLLSLIDNILDFYKLKSQSIALEYMPFNLESLLEDVLDLHLPEAQGKGVKLLVKVGLNVPFELIGDELRIKQIINNVVHNAIKFTTKGSVNISVTLLEKTDNFGLIFKIEDTGIGMDVNDPCILFQPYSQADVSISRRFGGTGLGLMICKNLVDLFEGSINIKSKKGEGTEVVFSLLNLDKQKENNELERLKQFEPMNNSNLLSGITVLIADDNIFIKELLEMILKSEGAKVISVDNGRAALHMCQEQDVDLVLLDYNMPDLNGYETCKLLRKTFSTDDLPVFLITADVLNVKKLDLKAAGIKEIIYKPIDESKLLQSLIQTTSGIELPVAQQKVLDFLSDDIIFKELESLYQLLEEAVITTNKEEIKSYAHQICGIAGPSTKYRNIEVLARKIESHLSKENYNQIDTRLMEIKEAMNQVKTYQKTGGGYEQ